MFNNPGGPESHGMISVIATFLTTRISDEWKAASALAGAIAFGIVVGLTVSGFFGLPEQVSANTEFRINHSREFQALVCLITMPDSLATSSRARMRECGL